MADNIGKETAGGWGRVVAGGSKDDHITITNEKSDEGPGFHITNKTPPGLPNIRDYFTLDGKFGRTE